MNRIKRIENDRIAVAATVAGSALGVAVLAACGGGGTAALIEAAPSEGAATVQSASAVQLEGCVVDQYYIPRTGSTVRARSADGRLIGDATSDRHGVFRLKVPARQTVSVALVHASGEALVVPTGSIDVSVGACLQHRED